MRAQVMALLALGGCVWIGEAEHAERQDADADGHPFWDDCDDEDPLRGPATPEVCDGEDDDCDGEIDEGASDARVFYADADGDGFGDPGAPASACAAPAGHVEDDGDCDDASGAVHPGAVERCDGVDEDCDGDTDEDAVDPSPFFPDADGDGDGDRLGAPALACAASAGTSPTNRDCDDADPTRHGGAGCALEGEVAVTDADARLVGAGAYDAAGFALAAPGDVDGDGRADLWVGAADASDAVGGGGAVYLVSRPAWGVSTLGADPARILGTEATGSFGAAVASLRDASGDGAPDLLVGAPYARGKGIVYYFAGPVVGALTASDATARIHASEGDFAGNAVTGWERGGRTALVFGAPGEDAERGGVYVFEAPPPAEALSTDADIRLLGDQPDAMAGWTVAPAGDVDGDGAADLLVGAPYHNAGLGLENTGRVYVISGADVASGLTATLSDVAVAWRGEGLRADAGVGLQGEVDLDGDGRDDFLVGAPGDGALGNGAGRAHLVLGSASSSGGSLSAAAATLHGHGASSGFGYAISRGDFDCDGAPVIVVGAPTESTDTLLDTGAAYLYRGPLAGTVTEATARFGGRQAESWAGHAVLGFGDANADGCGDLAVGAPLQASPAGEASGAVFLFLGGG